ncbi:nose resistant to fluoxetine protein 6-like [Octopus sinensis]|uniref:Nose resistant to fluoxetine protein 6-like n=1 Tax=Octopus sinensis TaxID=2607531 RepID=A0A6P7T2Z9_9MOLL|nr:nose resistant to fluoxetine protein 6-like [Octopus sinensis]
MNKQILIIIFLVIIPTIHASLKYPPHYLQLWRILANSKNLSSSPYHDAEGYNYLDKLSTNKYLHNNKHEIEKAKSLIFDDICVKISSLNVSKKCCEDTKTFLGSLVHRYPWALQMLDSYGKPPSGILEGDFTFPGSFDECNSAKVAIPANSTEFMLQPFKPKYCQVIFPIKALTSMNDMLVGGSIGGLHMGACFPDSCQAKDIQNLIQYDIHLLPKSISGNISSVVQCEEDRGYDSKAIISLIIISIFLLHIFLGTLYDVLLQSGKSSSNAAAQNGINNSLPTSTQDVSLKEKEAHVNCNGTKTPSKSDEELDAVSKFLLTFSVYKNAKKLLSTNQPDGTLTCIHGIRFLSMTWVILGHTYIFGMPIWRNLTIIQDFAKNFAFQGIANAMVSVDTFFLLSGLLVSYGNFKALEKTEGKFGWVYYYIHRFWRLTPPYMLVMMVYIPLFRYWGDGPYWPKDGFEINYCKDTWYFNLLYINNFLSDPQKGMCMSWTWYLSNDMQFYIISPIFILALYHSEIVGFVLIGVFSLAQLITTGVVSTTEKLPPVMFSQDSDISQKYFTDIYVKPYIRIGPYLIGILVGYLLYKNKCKMRMNRYVCAVLWMMATISAVSILYGLYNLNNGYAMTQDTASFYTTANRSVWGLCVGWVIYACCTGYGGYVNTILSWKALIPLSRLTYCAYLVHPIMMYYFYLNQRYSLHLTYVLATFLFFGFMIMAFMIAFIVSMAFEAPMIGLERLILELKRKKKNNN